VSKSSALEGIRVIDHTHVIAGSYCGRLLAEMGAEVIKVEPPAGELFRHQGPKIDGESLLFSFLNVNKKSITLNLKHETGKKMLFDLVKKSDIFLENYKPGTMEKLGVGYEEQRKVNPSIIYASISGFGQYGPYKDYPAFDYLIQSMTGLREVNGFPDRPVRIGPAVTDFGSGMLAAYAITSALIYRQRTGKGQKIDISMYDTAVVFLMEHLAYYIGSLPLRVGDRFQLSAPANTYPAKDGELYISIFTDKMWQDFLQLSGQEDFSNDPRFSTPWQRALNVDVVDDLVSKWTMSRTVSEIVNQLTKIGAVCGLVKSIGDLFSDPHIAARKMLVKVTNGGVGNTEIPGSPIKMSLTPGCVKSAGPSIAKDNEDVYMKILGLSKDEIASLRNNGVI